jgi:D-sedoheptulose 7-phosphate isomerase
MIKDIIIEHINVGNSILKNISSIEKLCTSALSKINNGNKILLCGNGGSASDSSHIAAEFVGKFKKDRKPLSAISLNDNLSTITAIGNDYGFNHIFSRQIKAIGKKDDILIAISTSGNSLNVIEAIKMAISMDIECYALTGKAGGKISKLDCNLIKVDSNNTARIQEMHILIGHIICEFVDKNFT